MSTHVRVTSVTRPRQRTSAAVLDRVSIQPGGPHARQQHARGAVLDQRQQHRLPPGVGIAPLGVQVATAAPVLAEIAQLMVSGSEVRCQQPAIGEVRQGAPHLVG